MLAHHSKLTWLGDSEFLVDFVPAPGTWPDVTEFWRIMTTEPRLRRDVKELGLRFDSRLAYPDLVNRFLQQVQDRHSTPVIGVTVHRYFDRLVSLWPKARYIHIVRDGRDVARSRIGMGWAGNVWTASFVWAETERLWDRVRRHLRPEQVHEVRYESLVRSPEAELRKICDFLGVEYDSSMLNYPKTTTYSAPDPRLSCQWRRKLDKTSIRLAESVQGDMLQRRGYDLSGLSPVSVGPVRAALLKLQCRAYRMKFRVNRLGVRLYVEDVISRRIGPDPWRAHVARRRDQVTRRYLK